MKLFVKGEKLRYEMENVLRMFFFDAEVAERAATKAERDGLDEYALLYLGGKTRPQLTAAVHLNAATLAKTARLSPDAGGGEIERKAASMLFELLVSVTGTRPSWGIITGVRPAKFVRRLRADGRSDEAVAERLRYDYHVSREKAALAIETAAMSDAAAKLSGDDSYSLYISIPFCPSRCEYCSFVSKTIERERHLVEPYLDGLVQELEVAAAAAKRLSLKLETIYVGGGTPTVLSASQLQKLCSAVAQYFPASGVREYTVEAGRPDTISLDKLRVLRDYGVTRISINPQTFDDNVLRLIGRNHTAADVERAFADAKAAGFENINADLIAGLRGDTLAGFHESLARLLRLSPAGITVHALTLKRASRMREGELYFSPDAEGMVDESYRALVANGYRPYYMYKQKGTVQNLENVGYAKPGCEGLYNIFIMDEVHSILSVGAGGVTKLRDPKTDRIERIFNYKYPLEYIEGFDTVLKRKEGIISFYENAV